MTKKKAVVGEGVSETNNGVIDYGDKTYVSPEMEPVLRGETVTFDVSSTINEETK
jgi:hypothetical protein